LHPAITFELTKARSRNDCTHTNIKDVIHLGCGRSPGGEGPQFQLGWGDSPILYPPLANSKKIKLE
jgi:hypothetical protein